MIKSIIRFFFIIIIYTCSQTCDDQPAAHPSYDNEKSGASDDGMQRMLNCRTDDQLEIQSFVMYCFWSLNTFTPRHATFSCLTLPRVQSRAHNAVILKRCLVVFINLDFLSLFHVIKYPYFNHVITTWCQMPHTPPLSVTLVTIITSTSIIMWTSIRVSW